MLKVLNKRPCHFNRWSFALERWEPTIREDFPNTMLFWVQVSGVPNHYKKIETYTDIGEALGELKNVDLAGERVQVLINGDKPLQFERKAGFENGDVIKVKLKYEDLFRYCFTCRMISHIESTCPELTEEEGERKKRERAEQMLAEEFPSQPLRNRLSEEKAVARGREPPAKRILEDAYPPTHDRGRREDLREELQSRKENKRSKVWSRLDSKNRDEYHSNFPRYRERYHPYNRTPKGNYYPEYNRSRYENSYASMSRSSRYRGEREVISGLNYRKGRFTDAGRKETIAVSDSQRTVSDLRRTDRDPSSYRNVRNLESRVKNHGEDPKPQDRKGKGLANPLEGEIPSKPQWRRKEPQPLAASLPEQQVGNISLLEDPRHELGRSLRDLTISAPVCSKEILPAEPSNREEQHRSPEKTPLKRP